LVAALAEALREAPSVEHYGADMPQGTS
jgi:hypothetical protein